MNSCGDKNATVYPTLKTWEVDYTDLNITYEVFDEKS